MDLMMPVLSGAEATKQIPAAATPNDEQHYASRNVEFAQTAGYSV